MIRVYAVSASALYNDSCYRACYHRSMRMRREKADALKIKEDKAACIAAGLLLEYAYKKFMIEKTKELASANSFGCEEKKENEITLPEIVIRPSGKPEFVQAEGETRTLFFNLSHSGEYVLCVMADKPVGGDIQKRVKVKERLVEKYFPKEEQELLRNLENEPDERDMAFVKIWAEKEAHAKLSGRGLSQIMDKEVKDACFCGGELAYDYAWAVAWQGSGVSEDEMEISLSVIEEGELFYESII